MIYKTKSAIIGRKKTGQDNYMCIITLFPDNDPHLSQKAPNQTLEFLVEEVLIKGNIECKFLPMGNDLVFNNLEQISTTEDGKKLEVVFF